MFLGVAYQGIEKPGKWAMEIVSYVAILLQRCRLTIDTSVKVFDAYRSASVDSL